MIILFHINISIENYPILQTTERTIETVLQIWMVSGMWIFFAELPAGKIAEFLVGFTNKGSQDMLIESVEAAFHYPMDHSFIIQNFSAIQYGKVVKPSQQATVGYSFIPAEPFAGRPFGLSINLAYRDVVWTYIILITHEVILTKITNTYDMVTWPCCLSLSTWMM